MIDEIDETGAVAWEYYRGARLVTCKSSAETGVCLYDHLGNTEQMYDATPAPLATYMYSAWGENFKTAGQVLVPYRFGGDWGAYHDPLTEQIQLRVRGYAPGLGRFLRPDPLGFGGGRINLYQALNNAPTIWIDPRGRNPAAAAAVLGGGGVLTAIGAVAAGITLPAWAPVAAVAVVVVAAVGGAIYIYRGRVTRRDPDKVEFDPPRLPNPRDIPMDWCLARCASHAKRQRHKVNELGYPSKTHPRWSEACINAINAEITECEDECNSYCDKTLPRMAIFRRKCHYTCIIHYMLVYRSPRPPECETEADLFAHRYWDDFSSQCLDPPFYEIPNTRF